MSIYRSSIKMKLKGHIYIHLLELTHDGGIQCEK